MRNSPYKAEIYLALNIGIALSMLADKNLSLVLSVLILLIGIARIISKKNTDGSAHLFAGYVVGIEVLFRMNAGGIGYEYGKYAVIIFFVTAMIFERSKKNIPPAFIIFMLLLIPSIFIAKFPTFDETRQLVSFNLSGPTALFVSVIYFYQRKVPIAQLKKLFLAILYPIVGMSIFIFFRSGSLEDAKFTTESNFQTSGGFGPNQVSTMFGLGVLIIAAAYFLRIRLFRIKYLEVVILFGLIIRGFATFSRGGVLAPIISILFCIAVMSFTDSKFQAKIGKTVYAFIGIVIVLAAGFYYVNDISGGKLELRYKGESMYNEDKSNLFSGRDELLMEDIEIFQKNLLLGVGPGMASQYRYEISGIETSAHIEFSRLLSEHGLLGLISILIIIIFPINYFFKLNNPDNKIILLLCTMFVFITMSHAAMRTAVPGFIYGLAYIFIIRPRP
ncbi:MAG TPA: O-antigen ligase family protein [Ignavibacteria bacterium]|nr:O-antigen ligase family protein [Ignavibacteria bacterium]